MSALKAMSNNGTFGMSARSLPRAGQNPAHLDDHEALERFDHLLKDSIERRMVADVPLGAFLSGGIDSSLIVSRMQQLSNKPVKTFTIGFSDPRFDETEPARTVAHALGTDHHELVLEPSAAMDIIPDLATWYDEPFADASQLPTLLVSELARQHVTVSLSGDGGDELFAGYTRYDYVTTMREKLAQLPAALRTPVAMMAKKLPSAAVSLLASLGKVAGRELRLEEKRQRLEIAINGSSPMFMRDVLSHWAPSIEIDAPAIEEPVPQAWLQDIGLEDPGSMQLADMLTYLPEDILTKVDRASMAKGLEARVPLLDHRLVELTWSLAPNQRFRPGPSKWLLRELLARDLPREMFLRPKQGFSIPHS